MNNSVDICFNDKSYEQIQKKVNSTDINNIDIDSSKFKSNFDKLKLLQKKNNYPFLDDCKLHLEQLLQCYNMNFKELTEIEKKWLVFALKYFIEENDLIPDFIPVFGFIDDSLILNIAYHKVIKKSTSNNFSIKFEISDKEFTKIINNVDVFKMKKIDLNNSKIKRKLKNFSSICQSSEFSYLRETKENLEILLKHYNEHYETLGPLQKKWLVFSLDYFFEANDFIPDAIPLVGVLLVLVFLT